MREVWLEWGQLEKKLIQNDYVLFGTGIWAEKTMKKIAKKPLNIYDNNTSLDGSYFKDTMVRSPQKIKEINENTIILIATVSWMDVAKQLTEMGFTVGHNVFCTPSLLNQRISSDIKSNEQKLIFTCSDSMDINSKSRGAGIYTFDTKTRELNKIHSGRCQEIIKTKDFYYFAEESLGVQIFDKELKLVKTIENPDGSSIHGLAYDEENHRMFVANTTKDLVMVLDLKTGKYVDEILLSRPNKKGEVYRHHMNDLCYFKESLYVSMFSFSGLWQSGIYDGGVARVNVEEKKIDAHIISNMWMPHSVDFINEEFVILDSMRGDVYKTNNKVMVHLNGFVRGITFDGNYYYIGQSEHRYFDRLKDTGIVVHLNCGINVYDEFTKACRFYSFEDMSNIHCIEVQD